MLNQYFIAPKVVASQLALRKRKVAIIIVLYLSFLDKKAITITA